MLDLLNLIIFSFQEVYWVVEHIRTALTNICNNARSWHFVHILIVEVFLHIRILLKQRLLNKEMSQCLWRLIWFRGHDWELRNLRIIWPLFDVHTVWQRPNDISVLIHWDLLILFWLQGFLFDLVEVARGAWRVIIQDIAVRLINEFENIPFVIFVWQWFRHSFVQDRSSNYNYVCLALMGFNSFQSA